MAKSVTQVFRTGHVHQTSPLSNVISCSSDSIGFILGLLRLSICRKTGLALDIENNRSGWRDRCSQNVLTKLIISASERPLVSCCLHISYFPRAILQERLGGWFVNFSVSIDLSVHHFQAAWEYKSWNSCNSPAPLVSRLFHFLSMQSLIPCFCTWNNKVHDH